MWGLSGRCADSEPHDMHNHDVEVEVTCSGKSRCGEVLHPEHTITETQQKHCEGICEWCPPNTSRGVHGNGAHK